MSGSIVAPNMSPSGVLHRLAQARRRERRVRYLAMIWGAIVFIWLLPLGMWNAPALPPMIAGIVGVVLALAGAAIAVRYHMVSSTALVQCQGDTAVGDEAPRTTAG